jgi:hypothetical protein
LLIEVPEWRQDILEEHYEELESLLNRRFRSQRSPDLDAVALARIDARIEGHVDALALADEHAWPSTEKALGSGEIFPVAAATLVIASGANRSHEAKLVEAFASSTGALLVGLPAMLELRASARLRDALASVKDPPPHVAVVGSAIAVAHDRQAARRVQPEWRKHDDPRVRRCAWRIEARLARHDRERLATTDWRAGLDDPDPGVHRAVLFAAARSGQRWLIDHVRKAAERPSAEAQDEYWLLAILGDAPTWPRVLEILQTKALGLDRFRLLSAFGYAAAVEELLRVMHAGTPLDGALAADAFFRITGVRADRPERIPRLEPEAAPDELADEVRVCDPEGASRAWSTLKGKMGDRRWVRGLDAAALDVDRLPKTIDLEARWGLQVRAAMARAATPAWDPERFPFE